MRLCDKCCSVLTPEATFCEECGAPLGESPGSDSIVYPEIARANLLRLKGNLAEAETVCLAVLKRFPNNPAANGMMGDLCFEAGKLEDARQWYEMALELTPKDVGLRRKLQAVAESSEREHVEASLAGLEIPANSGAKIASMVGIVLLLVALAGLMFWLGYANKKTRADVIDPISINGEAPPRTTTPSVTEPETTAPPPSVSEPSSGLAMGMTAEEAALKTAIQSELGEVGARVGSLIKDSSGAVATLTGADSDQIDAAQVGAWLVRRGSPQAFVRVLDPSTRTVRFSGTVTKAALDAVTAEPGTAEWAAAVLSSG